MIKTVVFDIGNVLVNFNWKQMYLERGISEEKLDRVAKATVLNPLWIEFDKGILPFEKIVDMLVEQDKEIEKEIRLCLMDTSQIVTKREFAIPLISSLKEKGLQVLVLSNFNDRILKECVDAMDFLPYTDGGVISYQDHFVKPQPEIYQLLLARYGLNAKECVFIDDIPKNIEEARNQGMKGIVFHSYEQMMKELEEVLSEKF